MGGGGGCGGGEGVGGGSGVGSGWGVGFSLRFRPLGSGFRV